MKHFRALQTTFDDPSDIDDCTLMYAGPDHEDDDSCECLTRQHLRTFITQCGETRCRGCGRRVG